MAKTSNYQWDLPSPTGIQITEISRIATTFSAIDIKVKSFETALSAHKHAFSDLTDRPTTLGGYGITDGMTAQEVADAIKTAVDELIGGSSTALDTLKELADALGNDPDFATSVGDALGVRVRVDAAQSFSAAQKSRGRSNIDAVGTGDVGISVAPLGSDGKVPSGYLPALTTTATVGAAVAGANSKQTPADGDFFAGVEAGGSTMFKTTWGNIKAAFTAIVNSIVSGNMSGRAYPRVTAGGALDFIWSGQTGKPKYLLGAASDAREVHPYTLNSVLAGLQPSLGFTPARQIGTNIMALRWSGSVPLINVDNGGFQAEIVTSASISAWLGNQGVTRKDVGGNGIGSIRMGVSTGPIGSLANGGNISGGNLRAPSLSALGGAGHIDNTAWPGTWKYWGANYWDANSSSKISGLFIRVA